MTTKTGRATLEVSTKLFGLDHLRTLAILLVFLFHYGRMFPHPQWTNSISKFGWTGVDLFFVLSGYLISSQLFARLAKEEKISFSDFFLKRFFRIIPAYLLVVIIYFSFPYVHEREALAPLWKYLTFTQNLGLDLRTQGTFSHAWSLCIEEQFYLLLPLILSALVYFNAMKRGWWLILVFFAFGFFVRYYAYQNFVTPNLNNENAWVFWYKWIYYPTYCRLDGLLTGITIAALLQYQPKIKEQLVKYGNTLLVISLLVLTGAYFLCLDEESIEATVFGFPLVSIGYGLMVLGAICPTSILYKFQSNVTAVIAALSYAIYLIHKFVIHITQDQLSKLNLVKNSNIMFFLCLTTVIIGAFLMHRIVEKPFLKLRDRLMVKKMEAPNNQLSSNKASIASKVTNTITVDE